jgi:hypothetical protein
MLGLTPTLDSDSRRLSRPRLSPTLHYRRHCELVLQELAPHVKLSRANNVPNLIRRVESRLRSHPRFSDDLNLIRALVSRGTKTKV